MKKIFLCIPMWLGILFVVSAGFAGDRTLPKNLGAGEGEYFDSASFQSNIRSDKSLGSLAKENTVIGDTSTSFGFAEKSEEAKFFLVGSLYSEALAYLKSGKTDDAAKRLESIEKEFINLRVPSSLYNYISKTNNLLRTKRYDTKVLEEFLSLFQPFFDDYAKSKGEDKLTLFRAGAWLMDTGLAAAAGDKELLRQSGKLGYFITEMKKMDAPKGVIDALAEIAAVSGKKEITDADSENVLKLVKKIQTILG